MKTIRDLISLLPKANLENDLNQQITGIEHDSRKVVEGSLFACIKGTVSNGKDFVPMVLEKGAAAILAEEDVVVPANVAKIIVPDVHAALEKIVPAFYDYPAHKMRLIGVTGTNGKTTTSYMLQAILRQAGYKVGVIGTIKIMIGDEVLPINNTTPDVVDLQHILYRMLKAKCDYVVMEVSSHALALNRVAGCEFDTAIFTNLTRDHLDFHKTFENYALAKARLFSSLTAPENKKKNKTAVVNSDDKAAKIMLEHTACPSFSYSAKEKADFFAQNIKIHAGGMELQVAGKVSLMLKLQITGLFNVYNVLGAIAAAVAEKIPVEKIKAVLEDFKGVSGRFELVRASQKQDFSVIVDYAHTPDGLENILHTAREIAKARIITVFGCGGDRDRTKRPVMGKLAAQLSDVVIATSDNPRTEDPAFILDEVEAGVKEGLHGNQHEKIIDRRTAIKRAIELAQKDDIVVIAGKGHEDYQILKTGKIHFDDKEEARAAIIEKLG